MQPRPKFRSVIDALDHWSQTQPDKQYCNISNMKGQEEKVTYNALYKEARAYAGWLKQNGLKRGDRVIVAVPNGRSFLSGFLGTLMAGGVAVPVVCRDSILKGLNKAAEGLGHIFRDSAARYVLTTQDNKSVCENALLKNKQKAVISIVEKLPKNIQFSQDALKVFSEDIAFIQYTSGSTSLPKGVVIRHHQLVAQIESIVHGLKSSAKDCAVSWLPLFHDMGLIGTFLHSLYVGMKLVLMSPEKFIFDPKQWLMAISKHRGTLSTGPNSAYSMCLSRIRPEDMKGLNLSSWRVAFSGAEPINVNTMTKFTKRFEKYGFNPKSIVAGYGMAENCLAISFVKPGVGLSYDCVIRDTFEKHKKAIPADGFNAQKTLIFASVGKPVLNHEVAIVDEAHQILKERHVGEIVVRGPSVMDGYFRKESETKKAIRLNWLYTGDMGYLAEGKLYIVGRKKDMIIKGGRNYCPQDLEQATEGVEGIRKGSVIAFGVQDEKQGTEKIIILAEAKAKFRKQVKRMNLDVHRAVSEKVGIAPDKVIIYPGSILTKTSSGKVQRAKYKSLYMQDKLQDKITLWDRVKYFKFRVSLLMSMVFYFMSSMIKKGFQRDKRSSL